MKIKFETNFPELFMAYLRQKPFVVVYGSGQHIDSVHGFIDDAERRAKGLSEATDNVAIYRVVNGTEYEFYCSYSVGRVTKKA